LKFTEHVDHAATQFLGFFFLAFQSLKLQLFLSSLESSGITLSFCLLFGSCFVSVSGSLSLSGLLGFSSFYQSSLSNNFFSPLIFGKYFRTNGPIMYWLLVHFSVK
jgi:hypothetical protein